MSFVLAIRAVAFEYLRFGLSGFPLHRCVYTYSCLSIYSGFPLHSLCTGFLSADALRASDVSSLARSSYPAPPRSTSGGLVVVVLIVTVAPCSVALTDVYAELHLCHHSDKVTHRGQGVCAPTSGDTILEEWVKRVKGSGGGFRMFWRTLGVWKEGRRMVRRSSDEGEEVPYRNSLQERSITR